MSITLPDPNSGTALRSKVQRPFSGETEPVDALRLSVHPQLQKILLAAERSAQDTVLRETLAAAPRARYQFD